MSLDEESGFARARTGKPTRVAVLLFLIVVGIVVLAWAAFAFFRGSKEVADEDADLTAGHQFPSEKGQAPSLLDDDLSFANRETKTSRPDQD
jgi:hypothetical protein